MNKMNRLQIPSKELTQKRFQTQFLVNFTLKIISTNLNVNKFLRLVLRRTKQRIRAISSNENWQKLKILIFSYQMYNDLSINIS